MNYLSDFQLNEYLDNIPDPSTRRAAEAHLIDCDECRARLDEIQSVFSTLKSLPDVKLSHDLSTSIASRLPQRREPVLTPIFAVTTRSGTRDGIVHCRRDRPEHPYSSYSCFPIFASRTPIRDFLISLTLFPNPYFLFSAHYFQFPVSHSRRSVPHHTFHNCPRSEFRFPAFKLPLLSSSLYCSG